MHYDGSDRIDLPLFANHFRSAAGTSHRHPSFVCSLLLLRLHSNLFSVMKTQLLRQYHYY